VFLQNSGRIASREREVVFRLRRVGKAKRAHHAARRWARRNCAFAHPSFASFELENEQRQLIKRIGDFEAHQNQRCDHQIKAEMHERLETKYFRGQRRSRVRGRQQNSLRVGTRERPAILPHVTGTEGLRRRGGVPSAQMPWKILIPHSTTTMADTSVAAVNTLSKEATLMTLSASYPAQRFS
jgi:hypothetical protein